MTKPYIYPEDIEIKDLDRKTNIKAEIASTKGKLGATAAAMSRFMKKLNAYRYGYSNTQNVFRIYGFGSSVGVPAGGLPADKAPVMVFFENLKAKIDPANFYPLEVTNKSVGGSSINDFLTTQWPAVVQEGVYPDLALFIYGMNDFATALVNSGQTFGTNGFEFRLRQAVQKVKDAGGDVVLTTTPHLHSKRVDYNLPASIAQTWPYYAPGPVSGTDIRPTLEDSVAQIPWRNGTVPASTRFLWGNNIIRQVATDMGCLLLDAEKCWFDALLTHTEDELFNVGQVNHPNPLGHELSYWAAFNYFFDNLETGTWYDGGSQYPLQLQTSGTGLAPNPCTADIDLQATGLRQYAQILRDRHGRPTQRVDHRGNLDQFWYTSDAPTTSNPGYVAAYKQRLDRGGVKNAGDSVLYSIAERQGGKLMFHAWSSSLGNEAQMVELLVVKSDSGYHVAETARVQSDSSQERLFSYTVEPNGVKFTFKVNGTVYTCVKHEFGAKYE